MFLFRDEIVTGRLRKNDRILGRGPAALHWARGLCHAQGCAALSPDMYPSPKPMTNRE